MTTIHSLRRPTPQDDPIELIRPLLREELDRWGWSQPTPHYDFELERRVLGSVFARTDLELAELDPLRAEHFAVPVFNSAFEIAQETRDFVHVSQRLVELGYDGRGISQVRFAADDAPLIPIAEVCQGAVRLVQIWRCRHVAEMLPAVESHLRALNFDEAVNLLRTRIMEAKAV